MFVPLPSCRFWYQTTVRWILSTKSQQGYQPSKALAFSMESERSEASCGVFGSDLSSHFPGHDFRTSSTSLDTCWREDVCGPKLNGPASSEVFASLPSLAPSQR